MNRYIWGAVGVVTLAYILMAFVNAILPVLIVLAVVYGIYQFIFKKRW